MMFCHAGDFVFIFGEHLIWIVLKRKLKLTLRVYRQRKNAKNKKIWAFVRQKGKLKKRFTKEVIEKSRVSLIYSGSSQSTVQKDPYLV